MRDIEAFDSRSLCQEMTQASVKSVEANEARLGKVEIILQYTIVSYCYYIIILYKIFKIVIQNNEQC